MRITNNSGLPAAIVAAVENDPYNAGSCNISVTRLISPPRKVVLEFLHRDQITEDAADRIWSLLGQSIHSILERASPAGMLAEQRLYLQRQGWTVSGAFDSYSLADGVLTDYKTTSAYSVKDGPKDEWVAQMNLLATLLREHGHEPKALRIVALLRDWSRTDAARDQGYPRSAAVTIAVPMWSEGDCELYLDTRIRLHQAALVELPECSPSDRWQTADRWAVTKEGNKRAFRLCDSEADAARLAEEKSREGKKPSKHVVEYRRGTSKRCEAYCSAAPFCTQWQALKPAELKEETTDGKPE